MPECKAQKIADAADIIVGATYGKVKLQDENWIEVSSGREVEYNFFKVTVEMR